MYDNGVEAMYIVFNAVGTDKSSWFSPANILESSFTDLTTNPADYSAFSIHW